jgi:uncharacterized coiled-coil DUF342 family protein
MTPDELRAEVERLTRDRDDARDDATQAWDRAEVLRNERDELHVAWKREREEVERLTRERDSARDRILEYTDALVERDAEIASLTAALDERDVEAERVREQYDALATERDEARAEVDRLTDQRDELLVRDAYRRGAEAMREACAQRCCGTTDWFAVELRALPIPEEP